MNVKKYTNNTWREITPYKYSTSVETYTDLPQIIYANGNSASIGLKGALSQSGVPTPANPIQPSECGDLETTGVHAGQYKIPISSAGQTTPIYLGEVESTRRIKKLVLTGKENITIEFVQINRAQIEIETGQSGISTPLMSTHYGYEYGFSDNTAYVGNSRSDLLYINDIAHATSVANFKSFLAQQYANGTPVTFWYVLANETTGILNEPLRKIGDYADEVSGISIPTIAGVNSFDVLTTLKPSEVTVNYKGWHTGTVHERDSGQWE